MPTPEQQASKSQAKSSSHAPVGSALTWPVTIGANLDFSSPPNVIISVGPFEQTVNSISVSWNGTQVYWTDIPTNPALGNISAGPVISNNTLSVAMTKTDGSSRTYTKTNIVSSFTSVSLLRV